MRSKYLDIQNSINYLLSSAASIWKCDIFCLLFSQWQQRIFTWRLFGTYIASSLYIEGFRWKYVFAPKSNDFAPNFCTKSNTFSHQILLLFRTKFTTFSHQILSLADHVFAPIFTTFSHQFYYVFAPKFKTGLSRFRTKFYYVFAPILLHFGIRND